MPCYRLMPAYKAAVVNPETRKRPIVFSPRDGYHDLPAFSLPCGQCIGCRLDQSRNWAIRCVHEAKLHEDNCFITLTYNDEHLPPSGSLVKKHFQDFMKRLRHHGSDIRVFWCGEYGDKNRRPHYHALLFNFDFSDKKVWKISKSQFPIYRSALLESCWTMGHSSVGALTFDSAAYVARYCTKKITGPASDLHYGAKYCEYPSTKLLEPGQVDPGRNPVLPEFAHPSSRLGVGKDFYKRFKSDIYPDDFVVINDRKVRPPRYYDKLLEKDDPKLFSLVKAARRRKGSEHADNNTITRLAIREKIASRKFRELIRSYEDEH